MSEIIGQVPIRTCKVCGISAYTHEELVSKRFKKSKAVKLGYCNMCKDCINIYQKVGYHKPYSSKKAHQLAKRYNTTPELYEEAMASSNVCEICGSTKELCYDHDHTTMKFRGVLCRSCNKAIGALGDTVFGVNRALQFLIKHYDKENK